MVDEKQEPLPPGHVIATVPRSRVWNGRLFGAGTYPVPAEAKDWLEGKGDATEAPPPPAPPAAPAPAPAPAKAKPAEVKDNDAKKPADAKDKPAEVK